MEQELRALVVPRIRSRVPEYSLYLYDTMKGNAISRRGAGWRQMETVSTVLARSRLLRADRHDSRSQLTEWPGPDPR